MPRLLVGTSGWVYPHWRGIFYPEDLPQKEWFSHYSRFFDTVEINYSFYQLPSRETFESWEQMAPPGFVFTVKANRFITHVKKLKDPQESVGRFYENLSGLGEKCAAVLYQLPPHWKLNLDRLREFLEVVPKRYRLVFEFRDPLWLTEEVYLLLRNSGAVLCSADSPVFPSPRITTADFAFFRMHAGSGTSSPKYTKKELKKLTGEVGEHLEAGRDVFVYFNNDYKGFAIDNALTLKDLVGRTE